MRKLRFVFLLVAAVLIAGLLPGSFLRSGIRTGSSGGGGGGGGVGTGTASSEPDPGIYCYVERGPYMYLSPEVWENGQKLAPVDFLEDDEDEYVVGYDVYLITPGVSEIRFISVQQTKTGQVKAGSKWMVETYVGEAFSSLNVTSACVVEISSDVTEVRVIFSHL